MHALIFVVGAMAGISVLYLNPAEWIKDVISIVIPAIATLLAAFYGAKFAFTFQSEKEKRIETEHNQANASKAVLKLAEMINHLASFKQQIIDPHLTKKDFVFVAIKPTDTSHMKVEIDPYDLYFLCEGEHVNILGEFSMIQSSYFALIEAINERSLTHELAQTKVSESKFTDMSLLTIQDFKNVLGDHTFHKLNILTSTIIDSIPQNIDKIIKLIENINTVLKEKFPEMHIYTLDMSKYENNKQEA